MNVEDLLFSAKSLMTLQAAQAKSEGREFTPDDAMQAARPALEAVLGELLDLQRKPDTCQSCGHKNVPVTAENLPIDDYDAMQASEVVAFLDNDEQNVGDLCAEDYLLLHEYERKHQNRGSVLSKLTDLYGEEIAPTSPDAPDVSITLDKMFTDLFKN